jgi:hypothetical protein
VEAEAFTLVELEELVELEVEVTELLRPAMQRAKLVQQTRAAAVVEAVAAQFHQIIRA